MQDHERSHSDGIRSEAENNIAETSHRIKWLESICYGDSRRKHGHESPPEASTGLAWKGERQWRLRRTRLRKSGKIP